MSTKFGVEMSKLLKYYVKDINDLYEVNIDLKFCPGYLLAQKAAEDYHSEHDGWEDNWPLKITLLLDDGPKTYFVERDYEPVFMATSQ